MDEVYISSQLDSVFVRQEFHLTKYVLIFVDVQFCALLMDPCFHEMYFSATC